MAHIFEVKDKEEWDLFLKDQVRSEFLSSWEWGDLNAEEEGGVIRLAYTKDDHSIKGAFNIIKKSTPLGVYFYCPRPVIEGGDVSDWRFCLDEVRNRAHEEGAFFIRVEPAEKKGRINFCSMPGLVGTIDIQPRRTILLDLSQGLEDILAGMHKKTRYNIRLAERKGVDAEEAGADEFEQFWRIMKETSGRDGFRLHPREHYRRLVNMDDGIVKLYTAKVGGRVIAGNIVSFFGDTAVYMHGASSYEHRALMAPYSLQWHAIREAKERGMKFYDLFGVDEEKWPGVTRFKRGFGGEEVLYPGAFDIAVDRKRYFIYKILRGIRRNMKFKV